MTSLTLVGELPVDTRARLAEAGFEHEAQQELRLIWMADPLADTHIRATIGDGAIPLGLASEPDHHSLALAAGAVEVLDADLPIEELRKRITIHARVAALWRRRVRTRERRTQRAVAQLTSTQDLLGRLIDATPNPVMATDTRGRVLVFNRAAEASLGFDSAWAREHMHVSDIYADPASARRVLAKIRNSPNGMVHEIETRLRARTGEHIPVLLSAAEVYAADGMPMATVGVFQDQRNELALRNRLEETTEQLIETEKRATAMEVAGAAAHELNQPLTTVMGSLELIGLRSDLPPDVATRLSRAYEQLERMADIVRALARPHNRRRTVGYVGEARILDLKIDRDST